MIPFFQLLGHFIRWKIRSSGFQFDHVWYSFTSAKGQHRPNEAHTHTNTLTTPPHTHPHTPSPSWSSCKCPYVAAALLSPPRLLSVVEAVLPSSVRQEIQAFIKADTEGRHPTPRPRNGPLFLVRRGAGPISSWQTRQREVRTREEDRRVRGKKAALSWMVATRTPPPPLPPPHPSCRCGVRSHNSIIYCLSSSSS